MCRCKAESASVTENTVACVPSNNSNVYYITNSNNNDNTNKKKNKNSSNNNQGIALCCVHPSGLLLRSFNKVTTIRKPYQLSFAHSMVHSLLATQSSYAVSLLPNVGFKHPTTLHPAWTVWDTRGILLQCQSPNLLPVA